jgi:hypothetical protein
MGFDEASSTSALQRTNGNVQQAVDLLAGRWLLLASTLLEQLAFESYYFERRTVVKREGTVVPIREAVHILPLTLAALLAYQNAHLVDLFLEAGDDNQGWPPCLPAS